MRQLHVVAVSEGGTAVVVAAEDGEQLALPIDDRLRAAVRGDQVREGQLEIAMSSQLSPREIQTRVRAGATVDEVAEHAGISTERVLRFAAPVLDERNHMARRATTALLRSEGLLELGSLGEVVAAALSARGVSEPARWDAWRRDDSRWLVASRWSEAHQERTALWLLDSAGRSASALDDDARRLAGLDVDEPVGPTRLAVVPDRSSDDEQASPSADAADETPTGPLPPLPEHLVPPPPAKPRPRAPRRASATRPADDRLWLSDIAAHVVEDGEDTARRGETPRGERAASGSDSRRQRPPVPSWDEIMFGRRS